MGVHVLRHLKEEVAWATGEQLRVISNIIPRVYNGKRDGLIAYRVCQRSHRVLWLSAKVLMRYVA